MSMSDIFAILILVVLLFLVIAFAWKSDSKPVVNIIMGTATYIVLGIFYLVPFWLIFLK